MSQPIPGPQRPASPSQAPSASQEATDCWPVPQPPPPRSTWRRWVYPPGAVVLVLSTLAPLFLLDVGHDPYTLWMLAAEHEGQVAVLGLVLVFAVAIGLVVLGLRAPSRAVAPAAVGGVCALGLLLLLLRPTLRASEVAYGAGGVLLMATLGALTVVTVGHAIELSRTTPSTTPGGPS